MACDDEIIPSQERIEAISDEADLEEVYNTGRHLLGCRARRPRSFARHGRKPSVRVFGTICESSLISLAVWALGGLLIPACFR